MAQSKDNIKYGTAQARLWEDEAVRVRYKHNTPIEGGKIADPEPVELFADARRIAKQEHRGDNDSSKDDGGDSSNANTSSTTISY